MDQISHTDNIYQILIEDDSLSIGAPSKEMPASVVQNGPRAEDSHERTVRLLEELLASGENCAPSQRDMSFGDQSSNLGIDSTPLAAGTQTCEIIHRLIALAFHGIPSDDKTDVHHIDGNPRNRSFGARGHYEISQCNTGEQV